jgi:hypothetical protein
MLNVFFDFLAGFLAGRIARNTTQIAQRAAWSEGQKVLIEREAAQRALQERQRPLLYICLAVIAVVMVLGALTGG